ncbi:SDR family NAD(P)-dependent oxidoreductase [Ruicaihuangia caeni]|uniref:SDR family NAD(P)-dependent oxidoreductase n=1 Tax=Ruicaihuangia caeni TaxID=3042517 RepID=A0AAW6T7P5_9MICO|nr:SDR family NAD(P)-dependent oxidoreductase [Klugiella sp. YN-L-19]MDI2097818.1 SDR family NAD(P)-dependent oxidoreductase [Klugiella sp. YN-L-19]
MHLNGSSALVTGGASGLGFATASRLAERGAKVVITDLESSRGADAATRIGAEFVSADVTDSAQLEAAVARAVELAPLRIAVCCAGIATPGKLLGRDGPLPLEQFERVVAVNLTGTFNTVRLAANAMVSSHAVDGDRGVIVMTASAAAFEGQIGQPAYSASKGGVASMTLPLARELSRFGIRVVSIAPGIMATPLTMGLPQSVRDSLGHQVPHPSRLGRPEEFASLVEHVVTNGYLNGEVVRLDGAIRMAPR